MRLQLKKVKIYPEASQKSTCFHADLWIDDMCVAEVKNTGEGKSHEWKAVTYYQKFKPYEIEDKLKNAQHAMDLDHWVDGQIQVLQDKQKLQENVKSDEQVEIDDLTGLPKIVKKEKIAPWKAKTSKVAKAKEDYKDLQWIELTHKGAKYKVQKIGITNSHGKDYDKYRTEEGKIIHQIQKDEL